MANYRYVTTRSKGYDAIFVVAENDRIMYELSVYNGIWYIETVTPKGVLGAFVSEEGAKKYIDELFRPLNNSNFTGDRYQLLPSSIR